VFEVREIRSVKFKRIHIGSELAADHAGHWWFEIGDPTTPTSESYGWWPAEPVSGLGALLGVPGELNDGESGRSPPHDPHHAELADEEFHPVVKDDDPRSEDEIAECLRLFAERYSGKWQWLLGWGQNCHNFQRDALKHCRLSVPAAVRTAKF